VKNFYNINTWSILILGIRGWRRRVWRGRTDRRRSWRGEQSFAFKMLWEFFIVCKCNNSTSKFV